MCHKVVWVWVGLLVCWLLVATVGQALTDRAFMVALGAVMVGTTYASVRGPAWLAALRMGRMIERAQARGQSSSAADAVDLRLYRRSRDRGQAS
jgi:hypothetical protein